MIDRLELLELFERKQLPDEISYLCADADGVTDDNLNLADVKSPTEGRPSTGKPSVFIFDSEISGEWFLEQFPEFKGKVIDWADGDAFLDLLAKTDIEFISLWLQHGENQWTEYTEYLEDFE